MSIFRSTAFTALLLLWTIPATAIPLADFTDARHEWHAPHHVGAQATSPSGFSITVNDEDPWLLSPATIFPALPDGTRLVTFSFTCTPTSDDRSWQLFLAFGNKPFTEESSLHLQPEGRAPHTRFSGSIPVASVTPGPCRFRLDPPGWTNSYTLTSFSVDFARPLWTYRPPPRRVLSQEPGFTCTGPDWTLTQASHSIADFTFTSRGHLVRNASEPFTFLGEGNTPVSFSWDDARPVLVRMSDGFTATARTTDPEGRAWTLTRTFRGHPATAALTLTTGIRVDRPARILHVPYLTLLADEDSDGHKTQALLAGVEYLDDEPSSNRKEFRTDEANRRIPDAFRLSAPLAVLVQSNAWLAATWFESVRQAPASFATVFDSPNRLFGEGNHLLAFWLPAVGPCRRESELDIYAAQSFTGGTHTVTLRTGPGSSVADALVQLVTPAILPPPDNIDAQDVLENLAHGWLDSDIRDGIRVRHAVGSTFAFGNASDAPVLMHYLAAALSRRPGTDPHLIQRLRGTSDAMLKAIPVRNIGLHGISHVHRSAPPLVSGDVAAWLDQIDAKLKSLNRQLAEGKRLWKPPEGRPDLGETLGADHCNGYTAMLLDPLLKAATWSGNDAEIEKALAILAKATVHYHGTVPRGAQPWEMPLHTPDIMASARLARAYVSAYRLRPDPAYLAEARHWAASGLSMVYLTPPPFDFPDDPRPVGRYATCAVMGATHWKAPNWIGRPVQWCGLVYADALWDLSCEETDMDSAQFWKTVASGITASGARQNHTSAEPRLQGLLPDSWNLERQSRYAVPINPGTVQENVAELIGLPYYSCVTLRTGTLLHLPGKATAISATGNTLACTIDGWPLNAFKACVTHLESPCAATLDGRPLPVEYLPRHKALILTLPPSAHGRLQLISRTPGPRP